jgi:hypothetical protein
MRDSDSGRCLGKHRNWSREIFRSRKFDGRLKRAPVRRGSEMRGRARTSGLLAIEIEPEKITTGYRHNRDDKPNATVSAEALRNFR